LVAGLNCTRIEEPPVRELEPFLVIGPETSDVFGTLGPFSLVGCSIIAIDRSDQVVRMLRPDGSVTTFGRRGHGPYELAFPRSFTVSSDSIVTVMDRRRLRLLRFDLAGSPISEGPLPRGLNGHGAMGPILALGDTLIPDYWLAERIGNRYMPPGLLDTAYLVPAFRVPEGSYVGGWGKPLVPPEPDDHRLGWLLQWGDLRVWRDSLHVLRSPLGQVEVFSTQRFSDTPDRVVRLDWYRPTPRFSEGAERSALVFDEFAIAFDLDAEGRVYVVSRLNDDTLAYPPEALTVYDRLGRLLVAGMLPTVDTREVRVAPDGIVVLRAQSKTDYHLGPGYALFLFSIPEFAGGAGCGWDDARPEAGSQD
jgi:hypothetical protein